MVATLKDSNGLPLDLFVNNATIGNLLDSNDIISNKITVKSLIANNINTVKCIEATDNKGKLQIGNFYITWLIHSTYINDYSEVALYAENPYPFSNKNFFHFSLPYKTNGQSGGVVITDMHEPSATTASGYVWNMHGEVKYGETFKILTVWFGM